ncbi:MAG: sugar phosphate nucleotidyltransferase [Gammaproteobacteria bacterium]
MAGRATRLARLPCSKEIHPVESHKGTRQSGESPRAVCEYLFEKMHEAGITRAYVILREGKWDIPAYLGDGTRAGMQLAYLMMGRPYGTPYSFDQAYSFVQHAIVAFGFPDMVLGPGNIFGRLLEYQGMNHADVVLGLFPADRPEKVDMVEISGSGRVKRIVIKPQHTDLRTTWGVAVWTPVFTHYMHEFLAAHQEIAERAPELFMGDVMLAAIKEGLSIYALQVSELPYIDIGTPDDLERANSPLGD